MGFIISTIACVIALTLINKIGGKGERQLTKKTLIPLFFRGLAAAVVILFFCLVWNDDTFVTNLLGISNTSIVYLLIDNFLLTALVEEGFKYIALKTYLKKHGCIRCSHHAVVAAVAVAAGFTAAENIFYLMGDVGVLLRIVFGITGHYAYAVYMGYNIAKEMQATDPAEKKKYRCRSFWIPVLLHGAFDFTCGFIQLDMEALLFLLILLVVIVVYVWFFIVSTIKMIKETSRAEMWENVGDTENSATTATLPETNQSDIS